MWGKKQLKIKLRGLVQEFDFKKREDYSTMYAGSTQAEICAL